MNDSKYTGVTPTPDGQWRAQVSVHCKTRARGLFDTDEEAAKTYDSAAYYLMTRVPGFKMRLSFPGDYDEASYPITSATQKVLDTCDPQDAASPARLIASDVLFELNSSRDSPSPTQNVIAHLFCDEAPGVEQKRATPKYEVALVLMALNPR
jgi:hypothetical protein